MLAIQSALAFLDGRDPDSVITVKDLRAILQKIYLTADAVSSAR